MKYLSFILIASCIFVAAHAGYAVEDTFEVHQNIILTDTDAPSVPTGLAATAVSTSQIDVTWTPSTDNAAVTGYQVFRDSVFIATSSSAFYSDTGLAPNTLYSYTVTAFDGAFNISAQSATATATTLPIPPENPPSETVGGGTVGLELIGLSVEAGLAEAQISFQTNLYTYSVVMWGTTPDYEIGSVASGVLKKAHTVSLEHLNPGTTYYFHIALTDAQGRILVLEHQQFTTVSLPDLIPPTNVTNLHAVGNENTIVLTWNNPSIDFDSVRIVKSEAFYPQDIWDGHVVYEGTAEKFVDTDVEYGRYYYYGVFVKDAYGNYSSGAVTREKLHKPGEPVEQEDLYGGIAELASSLVHPLIQKLTLLDIDFFQNGKRLNVDGAMVNIQGDRQLRIALEYDKVPEVLKTITITLRDAEDSTKTFSFLLRVNKDKTAYEAVIAPLGRSGTFEFGIAIIDHKNQGLKKLAGAIVSVMPALSADADMFTVMKYGIVGLIFVLLVLLIIHFVRDIKRIRN